jgi:hypothetical protein
MSKMILGDPVWLKGPFSDPGIRSGLFNFSSTVFEPRGFVLFYSTLVKSVVIYLCMYVGQVLFYIPMYFLNSVTWTPSLNNIWTLCLVKQLLALATQS